MESYYFENFYQPNICSQGLSLSLLGRADIKGMRIRLALHTQTLQVTQRVGTFLTEFILKAAGITGKTNSHDVRLSDAAFHLPGRWLQGQQERLLEPPAGSYEE